MGGKSKDCTFFTGPRRLHLFPQFTGFFETFNVTRNHQLFHPLTPIPLMGITCVISDTKDVRALVLQPVDHLILKNERYFH